MTKTFTLALQTLFVLICAMSLTSCGFWKNDPPTPSVNLTVVPPVASPPPPAAPPVAPVTRTLVFKVDTQRSTGTIDLAMDPKGSLLGLRKTRGTAPLKGKITVKLTEGSSTQKQQITILDIQLTNSAAYDMDFSWGALVGSMNVHIAKGVLRIIPNDLSPTSLIESQGLFSLPNSYFTVLGHSQVKGTGLVLTKAVGNKKVNLTMKKTEPVTLKGSITIADGKATLHIPRAVLRDQFDLDGTALGLIFTADITTTAQNL